MIKLIKIYLTGYGHCSWGSLVRYDIRGYKRNVLDEDQEPRGKGGEEGLTNPWV